MFTRMFTNTLRLGLIAMILGLVTPGALAQREANPLEECLVRIAQVTEAAARFNHRTADHTIEGIRALDREGAPDRAIIAAGRVGKVAINHRTEVSVMRIGNIVEACVEHLRENDAPPAAIAVIIRAGNRATERVGISSDRAKARINHAVANAIEN